MTNSEKFVRAIHPEIKIIERPRTVFNTEVKVPTYEIFIPRPNNNLDWSFNRLLGSSMHSIEDAWENCRYNILHKMQESFQK